MRTFLLISFIPFTLALLAGCVSKGASGCRCTAGEVCNDQGECVAVCASHSDCGLCNRCDDGFCVKGSCACSTSAECDDEDPCNGVEVCADNVCQAGTPHVCSASTNPCFINVCVDDGGVAGCALQPTGSCACGNDGDCDDGLACNGIESCVSGQCQAGTAPAPPSTSPCKEYTCVESTTAAAGYEWNEQNINEGGTCASDNACASDYRCTAAGSCEPNHTVDCTALEDDCREATGACDAVNGCVFAFSPPGAACEHENLCVATAECDGSGTCESTSMVDCSTFNNDCQVAVPGCDPSSGCSFTYAEPGAACTTNADQCAQGQCDGSGACADGPAVTCNDGNSCTANRCDPAVGCQHDPAPRNFASCGGAGSGNICYNGSCRGRGAGVLSFSHAPFCGATAKRHPVDVSYVSAANKFYALVDDRDPTTASCASDSRRTTVFELGTDYSGQLRGAARGQPVAMHENLVLAGTRGEPDTAGDAFDLPLLGVLTLLPAPAVSWSGTKFHEQVLSTPADAFAPGKLLFAAFNSAAPAGATEYFFVGGALEIGPGQSGFVRACERICASCPTCPACTCDNAYAWSAWQTPKGVGLSYDASGYDGALLATRKEYETQFDETFRDTNGDRAFPLAGGTGLGDVGIHGIVPVTATSHLIFGRAGYLTYCVRSAAATGFTCTSQTNKITNQTQYDFLKAARTPHGDVVFLVRNSDQSYYLAWLRSPQTASNPSDPTAWTWGIVSTSALGVNVNLDFAKQVTEVTGVAASEDRITFVGRHGNCSVPFGETCQISEISPYLWRY